jgi:DNA-binding response OmpR family regulator
MTIDLGLPGQNGMSLIRELREHAETLNLPIVVVSAMAAEGSAEANGRFSVTDWLGKPIDQSRLIAQLESVIKGYGSHK